MNRRSFKILMALLLLAICIVFIFFRIADRPDIDWKNKFQFEEKHSSGYWLFSEMIKDRYGANSVELKKSDNFDYLDSIDDQTLLIFPSTRLYIDDDMSVQLYEFLEKGNEALFLSRFHSYNSDSLPVIDFISRFDSIMEFRWNDSEPFTAKYFWGGLKKATKISWRGLDESYSVDISSMKDEMLMRDSFPIVRSYMISEGKYVVHTLPELFANINSLQPFYEYNFNKTLSLFDSENVILHETERSNIYAGTNEKSPLKYVLSQPALRNAYYLLLITSLLYVLFSSKRKQRIIPTLVTNKNTSLEYVNTMSELFQMQNQNTKLIPHMEKVFLKKMQSRYFLDPKADNFADVLSKKSRVDKKLIDKILLQFTNASKYEFSDEQLFRLYNDIKQFYNNCK